MDITIAYLGKRPINDERREVSRGVPFMKHFGKINKTPSPTLKRVWFDPLSRKKKKPQKKLIEGISLFSSLRRGKVLASMTVEAAVLLPLVMFFFLHIMGAIEMLRLHGKLSLALWECGNQLTVYSAMPGELEERIPDIAVSYLYVGNRVKAFLGKEYLENSPIVQGCRGLNYLSSSYEEDCIDIGVTYQVMPPISLFPFGYMRMVNRYYGRAWTGFDVEKELKYVYVTLYGAVWHETAECTHIFITIQDTDRNSIQWLRNVAGKKYTVCELCRDEETTETVYYTEQGTHYHNSRKCSSLTRYISAVLWQEDLPYRPCSRCVGEERVN